jgi:hypothetical protein
VEWHLLYGKDKQPTLVEISDYVAYPLWDDLNAFLSENYEIKPKLSYSGCSMDGGMWSGWNVKYAKGGKGLCSLYPKHGCFLALISVSNKDASEAEMLIHTCSEYTQKLWSNTKSGYHGKSLAFEATNEDILHDIKRLIQLRRKIKKIGINPK